MIPPFCRRAGVALVLSALATPITAQQVELPRRDAPLDGSLEDVFAVGTASGADHETFSNVPAVAFDGAGSLYVLDRDNARVMVFDRAGTFVRQIGRKGQGPGELGLPMQMTVMPDGRVVVFDLMNAAFSVFGADGEYETLVRAPAGVRGMGGGIDAHPADAVVLAGSQLPDRGPGDAGEVRETLPLLLVPLGGGTARTVFEAPSPPPQMQASGSANRREVRVMPPPALSPQVRFAVLPDGRLAVAYGTEYAVRLVNDGRVTTTVTRRQEPRAVSERDRDAARETLAETLRSGAGQIRMENVNGVRSARVGGEGLPEEQVRQALADMQFAETVQVIRDLGVDRDGRLWIARDGGAGRADEGPIDIVAADGRYVGTVSGIEVPDAFGPGGLVAYIEEGELDIPRVVVRRVPQGWR